MRHTFTGVIMGHRGWCAVGGYTDRGVAEPALAALHREGIDAVLTEADEATSRRGDRGGTVHTWVLVPSADVESAHEVLDRLAVGGRDRPRHRARGWPTWARRTAPAAVLVAVAALMLVILLVGS